MAKKNSIDEILEQQGFTEKESEIFSDILKYARSSQTVQTKESLKKYIVNKLDDIK